MPRDERVRGGVRESTSWERASSMRRGRVEWRVDIVLVVLVVVARSQS